MSGVSALALPLMAAFALFLWSKIFQAILMFAVATGISVTFALGTKDRRAQGKRLGSLIAIPLALYAASAPVLAWLLLAASAPTTAVRGVFV